MYEGVGVCELQVRENHLQKHGMKRIQIKALSGLAVGLGVRYLNISTISIAT